MTGTFTISLDFELRWGIRDNPGDAQYADAIIGGRRAIPMMLKAFDKHGVAATWATVGLIFAESRDDLLQHIPALQPTYSNTALFPFADVHEKVGQGEIDDPLHFGLSLIRQIEQTQNQEIGSHSFSHFYCLENGGTAEAFRADMASAQAIAQSKGIKLESLVLPRNQLSTYHLHAAKEAGIATVRGNPNALIYRARPRSEERAVLRALRLADSALPLTSTLSMPVRDQKTGLADTPASRFLRPIQSTSSVLARLQQNRIKREMSQAAQLGKNYHLWWHPHNFGRATEANIENLLSILRHFTRLRDMHGMQSMTMRDLANTIEWSNGKHDVATPVTG